MGVRRRGFTLVEMTVAMLILAAVAGLAIASLRSAEPERLAMAAGEVANALRYARSEAVRRGEMRAVWVDAGSNTVSVLQAHTGPGGSLVAGMPADHPLDPGPYQFQLDELPGARGVKLRSTPPFLFAGMATSQKTVLFGPEGTPFWWHGGAARALTSGVIRIALGDHERTVVLQRSGRVLGP